MGRILRNLGWLLGSRGINAVFSLIYLALATRTLGLEQFGQFALIVVMAQALAGIVSFNGWQAVVRWGLETGEAGPATGFALALDLVSVAAGSLLAAVFVWLAPLWLPVPPDLRPAALGLCLASIAAIRSTPTGILRLHDRYDLASAAEAVQPLVRAVGAIAAALFMPDIAGFLAAWGLAEIACAIAYWLLARKLVPLRLTDVGLRAFPARHHGVWRFMLATSLSRTLAVTTKQVVLLLVGSLGGAALAGGYRVASQLGTALVQLGEAVSRALYPELLRARKGAGNLAARVVMLACGTGLIAVSAAAWGGTWAIATLAGPEFAFAHAAMVVLALAGAVELLGASWEALLVAGRRAVLPFVLRAVPLSLGLALLAPAMAWKGLLGAALCMLLASSMAVISLALAARAAPEP